MRNANRTSEAHEINERLLRCTPNAKCPPTRSKRKARSPRSGMLRARRPESAEQEPRDSTLEAA
eukprot:4613896-Alexandrium_andersonii.AAC.1